MEFTKRTAIYRIYTGKTTFRKIPEVKPEAEIRCHFLSVLGKEKLNQILNNGVI